MFNFGKSSKVLYRELLSKTLAFLSIDEVGDSSIKEVAHRDFSKSENIRLDDTGVTHGAIATYHNNYGRMADGLYVRMPKADPVSYNVLTSVVLNPIPCQNPDYRTVGDYLRMREEWVAGDAVDRKGNRIATTGPLDKWIDEETGQWHPPTPPGILSVPPNIADKSGYLETHQYNHSDLYHGKIPIMSDDGTVTYLNESGKPIYKKFYGEVIKSNELFADGLEGLYVFVDGLKVPDSRVNLYLTNSNTNIVLAKSPYFDHGKNFYEIVVERRHFLPNTYGGVCVTDRDKLDEIENSKCIDFNVDHDVFVDPRTGSTLVSIDTKHVMVYIDGVLKTGIVKKVEQALRHIIVTFNDDVDINIVESIEVAIDSAIEYIETKSSNLDTNTIPYAISDSFISAIYGPRDKDNCMFFLNGLRVSNGRIQQKGRLSYLYEMEASLTPEDKYTIVYTNNGVMDDRSFKLYGDDYFYYNMQGTPRTSGALVGSHETDSLFKNIDTEKALLSEKYTAESKNTLFGVLWTDKDVDTDNEDKYYVRIQKLLKHNPYLMKDFLEYFGNPPVTIRYTWNGEKPASFDPSHTYEINKNVMRITTINGVVAKFEVFTTTYDRMFYPIVIDNPEDYFTIGVEAEVVIWEAQVPHDYNSWKECPVTRVETTIFSDRPDYTWEYRIITDTFGGINTTDDFVVLAITREAFDSAGLYYTGENFGYKVIEPISKVVLNGKIYITWHQQDPLYDKVIVSSVMHFGFNEVTINTDEITYESLFSQLSIGTTRFFHDNEYYTVKVPLIHHGALFVFNRTLGARMFRDTDFIYVTPEGRSIRESGFFLKRFFQTGDQVIFAYFPDYTTDFDNPEMAAITTFPNRYGLIYLGALRFPYSPDYVRINCNDRMVSANDVDIISNKLIRLPEYETYCLNHSAEDGEPCPRCDITLGPNTGGVLYNIYVDYSFKVPLSYLEPFISLVNVDTEFELLIANAFEGFDLRIYNDTTPLVDSSRAGVATAYYEKFRENVDRNQKTPNPIVRLKNRPAFLELNRYNLYLDAYLRYFVGFKNKSRMSCIDMIPEKVLNELDLFIDTRAVKQSQYDALITPTAFNLLSDIGLETHTLTSPSRYLGFYHNEVIKIFLECVKEHATIPIIEVERRFNEFPQSNILFKHDLMPISALATFEGDDILLGGLDTESIVEPDYELG